MKTLSRRLAQIALAAVLPLFLAACGVNAIPTKEEAAKAKWADVQNQYQRRADLIPNLVETVKGFANQEKSVLIGVNDNHRVPLDQYERTYEKLLTEAKAADPGIKLVLCEPFGLPVGPRKADWAVWNDDLAKRREIVAKLSRDDGHTWSDSFMVAMEEGMMVRSRPLLLADGDYLLPVYRETGHDQEIVGADSRDVLTLL